LEPRSIRRERIEMRRLDHGVPIAASVLPVVIGYKQDHVARIGMGRRARQGQNQDQISHWVVSCKGAKAQRQV
jgi:hypothetical protein